MCTGAFKCKFITNSFHSFLFLTESSDSIVSFLLSEHDFSMPSSVELLRLKYKKQDKQYAAKVRAIEQERQGEAADVTSETSSTTEQDSQAPRYICMCVLQSLFLQCAKISFMGWSNYTHGTCMCAFFFRVI